MEKKITDIFGTLVFDEEVMEERLAKDTFRELQKTIKEGKSLNIKIANAVANAMKDWAVEHGATHYTHWFQPMTGVTAEKHDGFIGTNKNGKVILEFSGKELIKGEPDASSFPNGGLRATFEARGYTAWDPTSYAFIKNGVLCIPTAFCSYSGHALDKKTPLLRSMQAINKQALRILKLFGNENVKNIKTTVGPEQEYFLVDKKYYEQRKDLIYTGRTLFGAPSPKGQEMEDHYFGTIKSRVQEFMNDLNEELWKLGVLVKTEHNEVAPAQHELAPIFSTTNIATDHNQLTMELIQRIAKKHGLVALLHEKPFDGINGSGKHNNWSLSTDTGVNLLEPGDTPHENAQFLLFLCAVIKAADEHQDLLRLSVATAGNDHRLGANEAPPAIISVFLGDELAEILKAIEEDRPYDSKEKEVMKIGAHVLPKFPKDTTDRNRTSPFAFTGNKFEFRAVGSSQSIAGPNTILNSILAYEMEEMADEIESGKEPMEVIKEFLSQHQRIIFNGDGYSKEWEEEAKRRGLPNRKNTVEAMECLLDEKNVKMFKHLGIYSEIELQARYEILLENYNKTIQVEALTALKMARNEIYPAALAYLDQMTKTSLHMQELGVNIDYLVDDVKSLSSLLSQMKNQMMILEKHIDRAQHLEADILEIAKIWRDDVLSTMTILRQIVDQIENCVDEKYWPMPTYMDLLFGI